MSEHAVQPARGKVPIDYHITEAGYAALARDPSTDIKEQPNWDPPMREWSRERGQRAQNQQ